MKKFLSVFLAVLVLCSAFSVAVFAEEKYPAPAAPANLALTADGIASWDAVDVPAYEEMENYETVCGIEYRVTLSRWDFDDKDNLWTYTQVDDEIVTTDTTVDFSELMVSGKYTFAVTAVANYERTMLSNGKVAHFKRVGDTAELDKDSAVQVIYDLYEEPIDTSVPFESLVKEDDETGNFILKIVKKIKEVFAIMLRFLGYAGDITGISEQIENKR